MINLLAAGLFLYYKENLFLYYKETLVQVFSCEFFRTAFLWNICMRLLLSGEMLWILSRNFAAFDSTLKAFYFKTSIILIISQIAFSKCWAICLLNLTNIITFDYLANNFRYEISRIAEFFTCIYCKMFCFDSKMILFFFKKKNISSPCISKTRTINIFQPQSNICDGAFCENS